MSQRDNAACLEALQNFVDQALIPLALEGFQSMYRQGADICESQSSESLTPTDVMKQLLEEVKTWTQVLLEEEVRRIEARVPYLQKLLTALFVMKVKVLSCINMRKVNTDFPLTIPSNHTFLHNMYIHASRSLLDNLEMVADMRMTTMRELLAHALRCSEMDCLRWDELLNWGLEGVEPSDALRDLMVEPSTEEEDTSAAPAPVAMDDDDVEVHKELDSLANDDKRLEADVDSPAEDADVRRIGSEEGYDMMEGVSESNEPKQPEVPLSDSAASADVEGGQSDDDSDKKGFWD